MYYFDFWNLNSFFTSYSYSQLRRSNRTYLMHTRVLALVITLLQCIGLLAELSAGAFAVVWWQHEYFLICCRSFCCDPWRSCSYQKAVYKPSHLMMYICVIELTETFHFIILLFVSLQWTLSLGDSCPRWLKSLWDHRVVTSEKFCTLLI